MISYALKVDNSATFNCAEAAQIYLEWLAAANAVSFELARISDLSLYHLNASRFAVGGSEIGTLSLSGSQLESFDASGALLTNLELGTAHIGTLLFEGLEGR